MQRTTFAGAAVEGYEAAIGWNEQQTTYTIRLIEDPLEGDRYRPPPVGTPADFSFGSISYRGIVLKADASRDSSANPRYTVVLGDPRELLAGVSVIVNSYYQPVSAVPNLLNVFGYWENLMGFGGSLWNESGMLWRSHLDLLQGTPSGITIGDGGMVGIAPAVEALTKAAGDYGGPIQFRGYSYNIDLSGLGAVAPYYRLGGGAARDLLGMAAELCGDAGRDFVIYLDGNTIKFKVADRTHQPPTGEVAYVVNSRPNVVAKSYGTELRNEYTNAVILGGDQCYLSQIYNLAGDSTIWPHWGTDPNGSVLMGAGVPDNNHRFLLNAEGANLAEVLGAAEYPCTIGELRCALVDYESWAAFVMRTDPDKATNLQLASTIDSDSGLSDVFPDVMFSRDLLAMDTADVEAYGAVNANTFWTERADRIYQFVRYYAETYYGRQFLVRLPFSINWKYEPETTHLIASDEISFEGGYAAEGSQPLGLNYLDENLFTTQDGRFAGFVMFPIDPTINIQHFSQDGSWAVSNGNLYVQADIDPQIYYPDGIYPYVVATLRQAVYDLPPDPLGGIGEIATIFGLTEAQVASAAGLRYGSFPLRIAPAARRPQAVAVPMKSNRMSYGPWKTTSGVPGKTRFERFEDFVPWNYGSFADLDNAANAILASAATNLQEAEIASWTEAGLPTMNPGDTLVAGGPSLTGVRVSISEQGVLTTYEMQTYMPQFGAFSKANADRIRRLGIANQQTRRAMRDLVRRSRTQITPLAPADSRGFLEFSSRAIQQRTPHEVIMGTMAKSDTYGYRTAVGSVTPDEMLSNMRADDDSVYNMTAGMSLEGLLRPYSNGTTSSQTGDMPRFVAPISGAGSLSSSDYEPFNGSDIDILLSGSGYPGSVHRLKTATGSIDYTNARGVGLKGPVVVTGWGREYTGKPFPNSAFTTPGDMTSKALQDWSSNYATDYKKTPEYWPAGPVALVFNKWTGTWTIPTWLRVTVQGSLPTNGSASVKATITGTSDQLDVWCDLGTATGTVPSGTKAAASYDQVGGKWWVTAAGC